MNKNKKPDLSSLPLNARASVRELEYGYSISRRLRELGFSEGAEVECVGESPLGGMKAYKVAGAVIAIRNADAAHVITSYGDT